MEQNASEESEPRDAGVWRVQIVTNMNTDDLEVEGADRVEVIENQSDSQTSVVAEVELS